MSKKLEIKTHEEKMQILEYLRTNKYPLCLNSEQKKSFRKKANSFAIIDDYICYRQPDGTYKRAIFEFETELIKIILQEEHCIGHPGMNKMVNLINKKYYGIRSAVINDFVRSCETCSRYNSLTTIDDIKINEITAKYDRYIMDCIYLRKFADFNNGYFWI
ncbi:hypothetical protein H311_01535 [Anncaliia algerae PRA109]|nr:hypothetical protein H311_01535 [Anncaliia algerae PRA109]